MPDHHPGGWLIDEYFNSAALSIFYCLL